MPATALTDGSRLPDLLDAAARRWRGGIPHAAAALAWKAYSYWLALPAVLGWASARRVPLLDADRRADPLRGPPAAAHHRPAPPTTVAVLPSDPLALAGLPEVRVVADEAALLAALRASLLDGHLAPADRRDPPRGPGRRPYAARLGRLRHRVRHAARAPTSCPAPRSTPSARCSARSTSTT